MGRPRYPYLHCNKFDLGDGDGNQSNYARASYFDSPHHLLNQTYYSADMDTVDGPCGITGSWGKHDCRFADVAFALVDHVLNSDVSGARHDQVRVPVGWLEFYPPDRVPLELWVRVPESREATVPDENIHF